MWISELKARAEERMQTAPQRHGHLTLHQGGALGEDGRKGGLFRRLLMFLGSKSKQPIRRVRD